MGLGAVWMTTSGGGMTIALGFCITGGGAMSASTFGLARLICTISDGGSLIGATWTPAINPTATATWIATVTVMAKARLRALVRRRTMQRQGMRRCDIESVAGKRHGHRAIPPTSGMDMLMR